MITRGFLATMARASGMLLSGVSITESIIFSIISMPMLEKAFHPSTSSGAICSMTLVVSSISVG